MRITIRIFLPNFFSPCRHFFKEKLAQNRLNKIPTNIVVSHRRIQQRRYWIMGHFICCVMASVVYVTDDSVDGGGGSYQFVVVIARACFLVFCWLVGE